MPDARRLAAITLALLLLGVGAVIIFRSVRGQASSEELSLRVAEINRFNILLSESTPNPDIQFDEQLDPQEVKLVYERHRAAALKTWGDFAKESHFADLASSAVFMVGLVHYLNAGDFGSREEADLAVQAFTQALFWDNGNMARGLSATDIEKRKMLELALVLQKKAQDEERKQQEQQSKQSRPVPGGKDGDQQGAEGKSGGDDSGLQDLPILGVGESP